MRNRWIAVPLFTLALSASTVAAQTCNATDADKSTVADTVRTLFIGANSNDLEKMRDVIAPSFYIFDNGQQFGSIDELLKLVNAYRAKGIKFVWNVTKPKVTIHCNEAWITYVNDGSIQLPNIATPTPTQWLESAILEKQDGTWKLVFMHSTRVPPPTPAAK